MTEKEKQEAGYLYTPTDDMKTHRFSIQDACMEYNKLLPSQVKERRDFLSKILGKVGKNCNILPPFKCDSGYHIELGENFFANYGCIILDVNKVKIGKNCMIAPNVGIYSATHPVRAEERYNGVELGLPITIGDNCWIGGGAIINPGVTLGNNVVVASGAVVTKSFGDNLVIGGNPARILKELK